ncbi:MAG: hypothetical protein LBC11_00815 [Puniceicoccales bacterium]|nr:hypothetical protein [Puniceicoccales bacterium]
MGDQVRVDGGPSDTQGIQDGQNGKIGQFGDRGLSPAPSEIQTQPDSKTLKDSFTSRTSATVEEVDSDPFDPNSGRAPNPGLGRARQVLEGGIRQAFFGRTDDIGDEEWNGVRTRVRTHKLK